LGTAGTDRLESLFRTERLYNIHAINQLPLELKEAVYRELIPDRLFRLFSIDDALFINQDGERVVDFITPRQAGFAIIEMRTRPTDRDCVFFLEIADTPSSRVEITFLIVNDPRAPRFHIDVDEGGRRTKFGTARRNLNEEERAMREGLAPGQVRRGLGVTGEFLDKALRLFRLMGHELFTVEPLAYHNAIAFERYGFQYLRGRKKMEEIHRGFQPGGELQRRLDGSTPFRRPGMEKTVRGRSWAIHDGILGEPWRDVEMYRRIRRPGNECTFPGAVY
jgi:hypothetical protein